MQLIDRHALLKNVYDNPPEKARMTYAEWCRKCIYEAPTIEAEPVRHGRWEKAADKQYCTECRAVTKVRNAPFCWHCGAKIDLRTPTEVQLDEADSVMMGGADNG